MHVVSAALHLSLLHCLTLACQDDVHQDYTQISKPTSPDLVDCCDEVSEKLLVAADQKRPDPLQSTPVFFYEYGHWHDPQSVSKPVG